MIPDKVKLYFANYYVKNPQADFSLEDIIMSKARILIVYHIGFTVTIEYRKEAGKMFYDLSSCLLIVDREKMTSYSFFNAEKKPFKRPRLSS